MKYITKEVKIGLAAIAAIALLVYGINFLKGINMFKMGSSYYVEFENVSGLVTSSPVYANGFNVGIVRDIHYNYKNPGHVFVEVEVEKNMRIPKGATAELVTDMLGSVKMNLLLSNKSAQACVVGDTLQGFLNAGALGEAANMIPQFKAILPKLDSILGSLNTLLADPAVSNTLHNTEQITANLQVTTRELNTLLQKEIPQITGNLNTITSNFVAISDNLKEVDYAAAISKIDDTLENVKSFTDKLNSKENSLGLLLNDPALYNNLSETGANAADLLKDLREHPKRYVHFSIWGKKDKENKK